MRIREILDWSDHPILPIPTDEDIASGKWDMGKIISYYESRELAIKNEKEDPYRYGFDLDHWEEVDGLLKGGVNDLLVQGGNRSSKSEYCAKRVVQSAMHNPESVIWCFQTTNENSIQMQQKYVWKYLPKELKEGVKSKIAYISYSQKNGFSDGKLVLPNASEIIFRNYAQDIKTIEGGEIGCIKPKADLPYVHNVGFWADELIPQDFLDTLRFRLVTRNAVGLVSFTAVDGYTPVIKEYMMGAKTEKEVEAELLLGVNVPIIQQPKREGSKIYYFHTQKNPYGGWDRIKQTLKGAHRDDILCRAYGVPSKPISGLFGKFDPKYNVIKHENIPFIKDKASPVTYYMVNDPAGKKPWFMLWAGVTPTQVYIWAEYPDVMVGDWADMSKGTKGRPGDGAKPNNFGIRDYVELITEIDDGNTPFERIIDSRLGAAQVQAMDMATSIIDDLAMAGMDFMPAPGYDEDQGIQAINNWLSWDSKKPMDSINYPKLMISDRCENLIYAMQEYTGRLGRDEPTKDPIDALRYFAISDIQYINDNETYIKSSSRY